MADQRGRLQGKTKNGVKEYTGLGGWLILPAIGFGLGPIVMTIALIAALKLYPAIAKAGLGGIYVFEIIVMIGMLAFLIYAAMRFFKKKSNAPRTIITFLIVSIVSSGILLAVELGAGVVPFAIETEKQLIPQIIGAIIWIPYFLKSKRVKATFID